MLQYRYQVKILILKIIGWLIYEKENSMITLKYKNVGANYKFEIMKCIHLHFK